MRYVHAAQEGRGGSPWAADMYVGDGHLNAAGTRRLADVVVDGIAKDP